MRVTVLLNRGAAGAKESFAPSVGEIARAFAGRGIAAEVVEATGEAIAARASEAATAGAAVVVAAGGDGTVSAVAGAVAGTGTALAVLPLGTFNNFASDLGVPADVEGAVGVIAGGRRRRLDIAEVNGLPLLNNSALGVYAEAVRRRRSAGSRLTKALSTAAALLPGIARPEPLALVLRGGDGPPRRRTTPLVFVGNNEYRMNLFSFGARERIDDGKLFVYLVRRTGALGLLRLLALYLVKDIGDDPAIERWSAPELVIESDRDELDLFVDGEVHRLATPLRYRVRSGALEVLGP